MTYHTERPEWWDEAIRLRREGRPLKAIAERLGKSVMGVKYATDEGFRERQKAYSRDYHRGRYGYDLEWTENKRRATREWHDDRG